MRSKCIAHLVGLFHTIIGEKANFLKSKRSECEVVFSLCRARLGKLK